MTTDFTILFSKENMVEAAKEVAKKNSAGVDGVGAKDACAYIEEHHTEIYNQLICGDYRPNEVLLKLLPKDGNSTKMRPIAVATVVDRIIQKLLNKLLTPVFDADMAENSYGFRQNHSCYMAVMKMVEYCEQGYGVVIKLDLSDCFNHLDQDMILFKVRQKVSDAKVLELINRFLKVTYIEDGKTVKSFRGSPQGSSLSPLYANLVLDEVDKELRRRGHAFIRYADDICILCKSENAAKRILESTTKYIENRCKLVVNQDKSKICSIDDGVDVLGFHLYRSSGKIHVVPKQKNIGKLKDKIKVACELEEGQGIVYAINPIIRGWVKYYAGAEISRTTKNLDLFIKRHLDKAEKRTGIRIDRTRLLSCHEVYKIGRHSCQKDARRCMFPAMNGAATNPNKAEDETAVSCRGRSPPIAGMYNN